MKYLFFLLILLIVFAPIASAKVPDVTDSWITSTPDWIVAGHPDSALVTLKILNQSAPVSGMAVKFRVNDSSLAQFDYDTATTDLDGVVSTRVSPFTKSGTVMVYADVSYRINDADTSEPIKTMTFSRAVYIDHDTPVAIWSDTFPDGLVVVGTEIPVTIRLRDNYYNVVDGRREVEKINISVQGSPADGAYLKTTGSWVKSVTVPVDQKGNFNATLKLSTRPGYHSILVTPLDMPMSEKSYYVRGIANGTPAKITSKVEIAEGASGSAAVETPYIEADGFSRFFITYTLYDQYDNPVSDQRLNFSTTIPGEQMYTVASTDVGEIKIYYGPKDQVGTVTLHVAAFMNSSTSKDNTVKFINSTATEMLLTANPETMPSREVPGSDSAEIIAKVVDENGNGVPNETVSFSIGTPAYAENYTITSNPSFDSSLNIISTSAVSDVDGYATVLFWPGGFTADWADSKFDETATGRCNITAVWNSTPHTILLTWKNYPYLSAETYVSPNIVNVTDNITVTLRLKGDGFALQPKPIDVAMCTDRSGSMLEDTTDRMIPTMNAAKIFVSQMNSKRDRIGLVSFGDPSANSGWARLSPEYVFMSGSYYTKKSGFWSYRNLNGYYYDWTKVYGVSSSGNPKTWSISDGCKWVYTDNNWDMTDPSTLDYWPYTSTYDTGSVHQTYINTNYKGNPRNYGTTDYASIEQTLSYNYSAVNNSIEMMVPSGGTPMREGMYRAVKMLKDNPRSSAVQAVILLSDGDWNTGGNPEGASGAFSATGITQYTSIPLWAKASNISIYTIRLGSDGNATALQRYATLSGGKYYYAATADQLAEIYKSIAGDLKTEAGVNTAVDLKYQSVDVNQIAVSDVFNYTYHPPVSTMNRTYWTSNNTNILGPNYYDQTADFLADRILTFNAGTIRLNQSWETTYMLQVNKPGNINVFGTGSSISFNNNTSTLSLPRTLITALPNMNTTGAVDVTKTLTISNLTATVNGTIVDLSVDVAILPSSPNLTVIADIYITDEDQHTTTWIKGVTMAPVVNGRMEITSIDLSQYQLGKQYTFYVDFINKQPGTNPVYWAQLTSNRFVMLAKPVGVYIRLD